MCQRGLMDRIANPWSRKRLVRSNRTISAKVFQGVVAHQVERLICIQQVFGSSPNFSTSIFLGR